MIKSKATKAQQRIDNTINQYTAVIKTLSEGRDALVADNLTLNEKISALKIKIEENLTYIDKAANTIHSIEGIYAPTITKDTQEQTNE